MKRQQQRIWRSQESYPPPISQLKLAADPSNPESAYYGLVGNPEAIEFLGSVTMDALRYHNHWCGDWNIALLGPASTGKTTLANALADSTGLPICELSPSSHKKPIDIFKEIESTLADYWFLSGSDKQNLELRPIEEGMYCPPPMHIFIDEVHGYQTNKDVTTFLLKALEGDRIAQISGVGEINCVNIQWTIATTHRGALFGPLDTRFTKLQLRLYSKDEIAQIVRIRMPHLPKEACELAAYYGGILPREVLQFAKMMDRQHTLVASWEEAATKTARMLRIDEYGMHETLVNILRIIGQMGTVSEKRLPQLLQMTKKELEEFQYPNLIQNTPDRPSLMIMTSRGYQLTKAGGEELEKREIDHKMEYAA